MPSWYLLLSLLHTRWGWKYLFAPKNIDTDRSKVAVMWCRLRGHPAGIWYYNSSGFEPDTHCKCCNDDLG